MKVSVTWAFVAFACDHCAYWSEIPRKSNPKASVHTDLVIFTDFSVQNALSDPSGAAYFLYWMRTLASILCVLMRNPEKIEPKSISTHRFCHFHRFFSTKCTHWPLRSNLFYLTNVYPCVYLVYIDEKSREIEAKSISTHRFCHFYRFFSTKCTQ
jgi:hypothetical protein